MKLNLTDKTVVITGGARGIGRSTAAAAAARGAKIAIVDIHQEDVARAATEIGRSAIGIAVDVTDRDGIRQAFANIADTFGGIDVVVANAGIAPRGSTVEGMDPREFDRVVEVNLTGVYNTVLGAMPHIRSSRGHILLTSSVYAFMNGVGVSPYAASKAGVEQLGRALTVELAPHGATAGVVYYGFIDTEMVKVGFDQDPIANSAQELLPRFFTNRISPAEAGEATVQGIERRAARTIAPRRWIPFSALRGLINPIVDIAAARNSDVLGMVEAFNTRSNNSHQTPSN